MKDGDLAKAAALARGSRHPLSQAVVKAAKGLSHLKAQDVREVPGAGLEGIVEGTAVKIGSASFLNLRSCEDHTSQMPPSGPELWVLVGDEKPVKLPFVDRLREDATEVVRSLKNQGYKVSLLSGDRAEVAQKVAADLGIENCLSQQSPAGKIATLEAMKEAGDTLLMVGDGLNDAPALRAADTSMSPSSAADVSQVAADLIFKVAPWHQFLKRCTPPNRLGG